MDLQDRLEDVRNRMGKAASEAGRKPEAVTLVAVSKTFDAEAIRPAIAAGQRVFGANRVHEAQGKWPELRAETAGIELHLIGPLQSNKTAEAVAHLPQGDFREARKSPRKLLQVSGAKVAARAGVEPATK